jgi:hypothetical protein
MPTKAHASPTKQFFVHMITKDITLEACILDLLDNCADGARDDLKRRKEERARNEVYRGYFAHITFDENHFAISDNCGGISLDDAVDYAFHFGRRVDATPEADFAVGLYGIGMKRAVFKMGKTIEVKSSTADEAFTVSIDVDAWLRKPDDWDFPLKERGVDDVAGTTITINDLTPGIKSTFTDPIFEKDLRLAVGRYYSFFIQAGLEVQINGKAVSPYNYAVKTSADVEPMHFTYSDSGVKVQIVAGMAAVPPENTDPSALEKREAEYYGWFVVCNDRVVVAADKSNATVWGNDFPAWHPQYYGFMGIATFEAPRADLLPLTTTKRGVDTSNPVYRRAVAEMKKVTREFTNYTNRRKESLELARAVEDRAPLVAIANLQERRTIKLPEIVAPKVRMVSIQYSRPVEEVTRVGAALGNRHMPAKQVGVATYEYYLENFVED